jgi:hypothetical protein
MEAAVGRVRLDDQEAHHPPVRDRNKDVEIAGGCSTGVGLK